MTSKRIGKSAYRGLKKSMPVAPTEIQRQEALEAYLKTLDKEGLKKAMASVYDRMMSA